MSGIISASLSAIFLNYEDAVTKDKGTVTAQSSSVTRAREAFDWFPIEIRLGRSRAGEVIESAYCGTYLCEVHSANKAAAVIGA